jgi:hypothetical protein
MKYDAYRPPILRLTMLLKATVDPSAMKDKSTEIAAVMKIVLTGSRVRGCSYSVSQFLKMLKLFWGKDYLDNLS